MKLNKEIEIRRMGCQPTTIQIEIEGNMLKVVSPMSIRFLDLCRCLIEHTEILKIKYERISPYKLRVEKLRENNQFSHKSYFLDFIEAKNGTIEDKSVHIIDLVGCNMMVQGNLRIFIPDLLLVMLEREYISFARVTTEFLIIKNYNPNLVEYREIRKLISPDELILNGYCVPDAYRRAYEKTLRR